MSNETTPVEAGTPDPVSEETPTETAVEPQGMPEGDVHSDVAVQVTSGGEGEHALSLLASVEHAPVVRVVRAPSSLNCPNPAGLVTVVDADDFVVTGHEESIAAASKGHALHQSHGARRLEPQDWHVVGSVAGTGCQREQHQHLPCAHRPGRSGGDRFRTEGELQSGHSIKTRKLICGSG